MVDLTARIDALRAQAEAGVCPFAFCLMGNCRLWDELAGDDEKYPYRMCPVWQATQQEG